MKVGMAVVKLAVPMCCGFKAGLRFAPGARNQRQLCRIPATCTQRVKVQRPKLLHCAAV